MATPCSADVVITHTHTHSHSKGGGAHSHAHTHSGCEETHVHDEAVLVEIEAAAARDPSPEEDAIVDAAWEEVADAPETIPTVAPEAQEVVVLQEDFVATSPTDAPRAAEAAPPDGSNDRPPPKKESSAVGNPAACLSCSGGEDLDGADGVARLTLAYNYEVLAVGDASVESAVKAFEADLLRGLAATLGLSCASRTRGARGVRGGRGLQAAATVVGVGACPRDEIESGGAGCAAGVDAEESGECAPIKGRLTAWASGSDESVRRELFGAIEAFSREYSAADKGVRSVRYLGASGRTDAAPAPFIDKATKNDGTGSDLVAGSGGMSTGALAGVVVGCAAALLAALAVIVKKRRGRKTGAAERKTPAVEDALFTIDDEEKMSPPPPPTSPPPGQVQDIAPSATFESEDSDDAGIEVKL